MQKFFNSSIVSRRDMLKTVSSGFGMLALAGLCAQQSAAETVSSSDSNPLAPRAPHFPAPRQTRDLHVHARGTFACRHVRLQTPVEGRSRQDRSLDLRQQGRQTHAVAKPVRILAARPKRTLAQPVVAEPGETCGSDVLDEQHDHRSAEPSAGRHPDAHRQFPVRSSIDGLVDSVRPGF